MNINVREVSNGYLVTGNSPRQARGRNSKEFVCKNETEVIAAISKIFSEAAAEAKKESDN